MAQSHREGQPAACRRARGLRPAGRYCLRRIPVCPGGRRGPSSALGTRCDALGRVHGAVGPDAGRGVSQCHRHVLRRTRPHAARARPSPVDRDLSRPLALRDEREPPRGGGLSHLRRRRWRRIGRIASVLPARAGPRFRPGAAGDGPAGHLHGGGPPMGACADRARCGGSGGEHRRRRPLPGVEPHPQADPRLLRPPASA